MQGIGFGAYDKCFVGLDLELKPRWLSEDFTASIRCCASDGKLVAVGTSDDSIRLFSVRNMKETGALSLHQGAVSALFFKAGALFSAGEDGFLAIWRISDWTPVQVLHGHPIRDMAVHASGALVLTLDKRGHLALWDLKQSKIAAESLVDSRANLIRWVSESSYVIAAGSRLLFYLNLEEQPLELEHSDKITALSVCGDVIVCGGELGILSFWSAQGQSLGSLKAHDSRVKALDGLEDRSGVKLLCSGSSDGCLKLWQHDQEDQWTLVSQYATHTRVTCAVGIPEFEG